MGKKLVSPIPEKNLAKPRTSFIGSLLRAIGVDTSTRPQPTPSPTPTTLNMSQELVDQFNKMAGTPMYQAAITPTPQPAVLGAMSAPTPTPPLEYRHPNWKNKLNTKDYQELSSGTKLANQKYPRVPQDLLMDIALIESGGRVNANQYGGPAQGAFQFEPSTLAGLRSSINPYSATESAELAAKLINNNQLSRWGVPGGTWGSLDASRREPNFRLSTYYSPEELNQFLAEKQKFAL